VDPPTGFAERRAPGEDARDDPDPAAHLYGMVNRARKEEGLPLLDRVARLDRIALDHARAMHDTRRLAHDVGDGSPVERAMHAGVAARVLAENVAHAVDVTRAHRTLWSSPSHRENRLGAHFDAIGLGIQRDAEGSLWVTQVLADLR
jgi:uncharacterized protein YkwD